MTDPYINAWLNLPRAKFDTRHLARKLTLLGAVSEFGPGEERIAIALYHEDTWGIAIPRQAGFLERSLIDSASDCTLVGEPREFKSAITLRPEQGPLVDRAMTMLNVRYPYGGLLCAKPGTGKTVMGLEIIRRLGRTTLILVHKEFLIKQWIDRINTFLPGARVGVVRQNRCEYRDRDIVLAMIQSLVVRRYPSSLYKWPGVVVVDEVHRLSAPTFSQTIYQFPAKVRLGLTATPRRKDGMEPVFFWHVGPIISYADSSEETLEPVVRFVIWPERPQGYFYMANGKFNLSKWITYVSGLTKRNQILAQFILKALSKGRKILALSDRLKQLDDIRDVIRPRCAENILITKYIGGLTDEQRDYAATGDLILGTYPMAEEGLDIPDLDTLVMLTPKGDVEQGVGRIQRGLPGKRRPVVIDMIDTGVTAAIRLSTTRKRIYHKIGAQIIT